MLCTEKPDDTTLPCSTRLVSEIISFFSIIFSSIIVYITAKRTKLNIINKLILQILISEIIDGIDILLVIIDDGFGLHSFENYIPRRGVCFTQIFLSLFVCLWTVISSFFISFRIFDIAVKKGIIFKKRFMKKIHLYSIFIPLFISFWFWVGQTTYQAQFLEQRTFTRTYSNDKFHFRHMHCWYEKETSYAIFAIVLLLILGAVYFSVRGILAMKQIQLKLTDELEFGRSSLVSKKKSNVDYIIRTLWIYPITTAILWILFFIFQICYDNGVKGPVISLFYVIVISIRQPIYALVFLFTQRDIKKEFLKCLKCQNKKRDSSVIFKNLDLRDSTSSIN